MTVTMLGGTLALLTTSCSNDDPTANAADSPRPTTSSSTTTTLTPEEAKKQEVIAAREAADEAWLAALAPPSPDPGLPALEETLTGLMFERISETAAGLQRNGIAERVPEDSQHRIEIESIRFETVDGQEVAYLDVCTVDDTERIKVSTGEVLRGGLFTYDAAEAMRQIDGTWKLAERRQDSALEGVTGCAAD